ncbi:MAG: aldo/keto reductase family protein [Candidatus Kariarchaeaceae archaeon]
MKYRRMGKYGIRLSEISLGAWLTYGGSVEDNTAIACINEALENGINFIDVADVYARGEAEKVVGKAISGETYARKDLVISSKIFWPMSEAPNDSGLSRKHIMDGIDATLDRFGTDYIDIYYCHRFDWKTPLEETISAMDDLVSDGRIRYWGTSVWSAANLERAIGICKEIGARLPAVEQPRYNMLDRHIELEIMETARYHGIGITPWSPLGGGILTGKYNDGIPDGSRATSTEFLKRYLTEETLSKVKKVGEIATELDLSTSQLALAWLLQRDEITSVITGASKVEQVKDNLGASGVDLSKDIMEKLEEILDNKPEFHPVYAPGLPDRS